MAFARVHDSRIAANADFGPGWRLLLAEEILVDGDAATYVDESGARHAFARNGTAWAQSPPTPRHAGTTLAIAEAGGHDRVETTTVANEVSGTPRMRAYDYDAVRRLVSVSGGAGATMVYAAGLVRIEDGAGLFE